MKNDGKNNNLSVKIKTLKMDVKIFEKKDQHIKLHKNKIKEKSLRNIT